MIENIIVPVSGGKDSQVTLSLAIKKAKETKQRIVCVHQNTGFDHPSTYEQLSEMEKFYDVLIQHTKSDKYDGMFGFLEHAKYFPNSSARGCTERLKQEPFARWLLKNGFSSSNSEIWFGMRADESAARSDKYGSIGEEDIFLLRDVSSFYGQSWRKPIGQIRCFLPIVSWTTKEVFDYIDEEKAPINSLCSKGHNRVGCYPCLLSRKQEWENAGKDKTGKVHIQKMIELEDKWLAEGNPRKFIKVHRVWDVRKFLDGDCSDLQDQDNQCGWCSI